MQTRAQTIRLHKLYARAPKKFCYVVAGGKFFIFAFFTYWNRASG
jgi:hypothetical protein